jgi:cholesterol oxidase
MDKDWVVIGSGFGGSVAALRLAEKGYDVTVLEQGRRFRDEDFSGNMSHAPSMLWQPQLGLHGILMSLPMKHILALQGAGVGGGSLVYANTLYRPHDAAFYEHPQWSALGSWEADLKEHYDTATRMLGVTRFEGTGRSEEMLRSVARELHVTKQAQNTPVGVFFGEPGETVPDPYFGGEGPSRTGCIRCGECMLGCRYNAKNTLEKNYLYLAERKGVTIEPDSQVVDVRPIGAADGSDGYELSIVTPGVGRKKRRSLTTKGVVLAGGAYGTNALLRVCKDNGSLPRISDMLGEVVRTNSEAIVASTADDDEDWTADIAITTSIYPDAKTHATNNTYGVGGDLMALMFAPLTSGEDKKKRRRTTLKLMAKDPKRWLNPRRTKGWSTRSVVFTVMRSTDETIRFEASKGLWKALGPIQTAASPGEEPSNWLPIANEVAATAAKQMNGYPQSAIYEALFGAPMTAHLLGGAVIGSSSRAGVVDAGQRAFGYENFMVTDGATMPANPGVNPSLTICAIAEHSMAQVPDKASGLSVSAARETV